MKKPTPNRAEESKLPMSPKATESQLSLVVNNSVQSLFTALHANYPDLSSEDVTKLVNILLIEIAKHLAAGEQIAFMRRKSKGEIELVVLGLEMLKKGASSEAVK